MTTWIHERRLTAVLDAVRRSGARTVLDLGCGDGDLVVRLAAEPRIETVVGVDRCGAALDRLRARLVRSEPPPSALVELVQASMTDAAASKAGFDCAVLVEAIEHIDPDRLSVVERAVFRTARPATVVITTPNADFNPLLGVPEHRFRHPDHRFEWGRAKFRQWARGVAERNGFALTCSDIAGEHPVLGGASQMAVFEAEPAHRRGRRDFAGASRTV